MSFAAHRKKLLNAMPDDSIALVYAGIPILANEDEYYPFQVNSQFFYLTGLEREGMVLLLEKVEGETKETLFIEEVDPFLVRWTGKMPTKEAASAASGIAAEDICFTGELENRIDRIMTRTCAETAFFDTWRLTPKDMPTYNQQKAKEFAEIYPAVTIRNLHTLIFPIRLRKDEEEVQCIREACAITKAGLEEVMKKLRPGMMEYEAQGIFEGSCIRRGAKRLAFGTIAGSGINGCMMHYDDNDARIPEDGLILLDLGAKYRNYCSDITRTYPAAGTFTPRQRQYYELVLRANKAVAAAAKPGMTLKELENLTCEILGAGLVEMGKISSPEEVRKYYMHSVSHSLGIDAHDIHLGNTPLAPGWVISDEPGLYIDEEGIGIRIEDDLLITENGCEVLSKDIIKEPDEIEAFMAQYR